MCDTVHYTVTPIIYTVKIPEKCLSPSSPDGLTLIPKGHCIWTSGDLRVTLLPSSEVDASLELGRIWEEGKDKWISLSDLSYPLECYTQILFPGGDKHPFSCFACSNLEFSSYSQISTVFTTMECFAMLSNLHYSEIWTHVKSRHCTHEAWYHFVTQITRWILNPRVVIVFSKFSTKL